MVLLLYIPWLVFVEWFALDLLMMHFEVVQLYIRRTNGHAICCLCFCCRVMVGVVLLFRFVFFVGFSVIPLGLHRSSQSEEPVPSEIRCAYLAAS